MQIHLLCLIFTSRPIDLLVIDLQLLFFSLTRVEVCSLLLAHGADPTLLNCHSKAAVDAAPTRELQDKLSCT